jgi:hypothetical protein
MFGNDEDDDKPKKKKEGEGGKSLAEMLARLKWGGGFSTPEVAFEIFGCSA